MALLPKTSNRSAPTRTWGATALGDADADAACIAVAAGKTIGWLIIGNYREKYGTYMDISDYLRGISA